ncbi:olfactory receptor 11L1-like [Phyllobates terribilis]|uniref:olfactory receptor 11L1-like n=1 Tax=Phyllobates terribilis TaxID=111132 RepID=UPI003CCB2504
MKILDEQNQTTVIGFYLLGFQASHSVRVILFFLLFMVYCVTICGNLLIITLVSSSKNFHTPMYYFISQLSISDILLTTDIVPNTLHILLKNGGTITVIGCIIQYCFYCSSEAFECFILTVMSYDRYVAICNPLHYTFIMTSKYCVKLVFICWLGGLSITLSDMITTSMLNFCGPNILDHFFCDLIPLLDVACSNIFTVQLDIYLISIPLVFIPTIIIVISYGKIIFTILGIPSNTGRKKAFSTCSSHLIVVSLFYWTIFGVYIFPTKGQTLNISKIMSLLYTVFTPMINPIIYSLRNKDIMKAVHVMKKKLGLAMSVDV